MHHNSLYARVTKAIINCASISVYYLGFFLKKEFKYPFKSYPIKSRCYILHEYKRFNNYWNPNKKSLKHFIIFLEFNLEAFSFHKEIT